MILNDTVEYLNMEVNVNSMLDEIKGIVHTHLNTKKNKVKQTMDILNSLPMVVELRQHIAELKKENQYLKDKLLNFQEKINIELEIVEVDTSLEKSIPEYFTPCSDSIQLDGSDSVNDSDNKENNDDESDGKDDDGDDEDDDDDDDDDGNDGDDDDDGKDDGDDDGKDDDDDGGKDDDDDGEDDGKDDEDDKDGKDDGKDDEEDDDEFSEDIFTECISKSNLTKSVEFGYTLVWEEQSSVLVCPTLSLMMCAGGRDGAAMQAYKINVDNTYYYIVDKFNSSIYNIDIDGRMGHEVGRLENGNVFFS